MKAMGFPVSSPATSRRTTSKIWRARRGARLCAGLGLCLPAPCPTWVHRRDRRPHLPDRRPVPPPLDGPAGGPTGGENPSAAGGRIPTPFDGLRLHGLLPQRRLPL